MLSIMSGPLLIFFAALLWGIDGILRRSLYSVPPITIVFYEHVIGVLLILPFFLRVYKKEQLTRKEWLSMLVVALFSGLLGTLFFTTALAKVNFIPFSVVFLLQKLQPVFTVITAALVLKEKPARQYWVWALLAVAAAYFVTFPGGQVNLTTGTGTIAAAVFAVLAAFCWGSTTAFSRYTLLNHSNTFTTGLRFLLTIVFAIPALYLLSALPQTVDVGGGQILRLFGIALSSGLVALWIYYRGLKTTRASVSTIVELAFPMTAVFIDYFLYHTTLAPSQYIAAIVLLFAVYKVVRAR
jgi:drug/metabolite transporter (DMT)-like permease